MANITIFPAASGTYTPNSSGLPNMEFDHSLAAGKTNIFTDKNGLGIYRDNFLTGGLSQLQMFSSGEVNAGFTFGSGGNATFSIRTQPNRTSLNVNKASGSVSDFINIYNSGNVFVAGFNSSGTFSGNSQTVTSLQTARLINSGSFNGAGNILIKAVPYNPVSSVGQNFENGTFNGTTSGQIFNVAQVNFENLQNNYLTIGSTNCILDTGSLFSGSNYLSGLADLNATYFAGGLSGDCTRAAILNGAATINGTAFIGDQNIAVTAATNNSLTFGSGFQVDSWNGSGAKTLSIQSGILSSVFIGSGAVRSGNFASGSIGRVHAGTFFANSGHFGTASVVSGNLASGAAGTTELFGNASITADQISSGVAIDAGYRYPNNFRLSMQSGYAIPNQDISSGNTFYLVPYNGNQISLYDSTQSKWQIYTVSGQLSWILGSGFKPYTIYDIFLYYIRLSGTLNLSVSEWSFSSGRGNTVVDKDGILVAFGVPSYRYVATFATQETTSTGFVRVEDSSAKRHFYNSSNKVPRNFGYAVSGSSQAILVVASPNPVKAAPQVEVMGGFANEPINYSMYLRFTYGDCPFAYSIQPYTSLRISGNNIANIGVLYNNSSQDDVVRSVNRYGNLNTQEQRTIAGVNIFNPWVNCGNPTPVSSQTVGVGSGNSLTGSFNM